MIKLIIVDDQILFRESLKNLLEHDPDIKVVALAGDGKEAFEKCAAYLPDIVLMDIIMPGVEGVEGVGLIKRKYKNIKIIMLTTFNDDENITRALQNGADGYVLKDIKPEELLLAIKGIYAGLNIIDQNTFSNVVKKFSDEGKISIIKKSEVDITFTDREKDILVCIVNGLNNKEIADKLYLSEGTVRNVISGILHKLNLRDRLQLAVYAAKNDFI